MKQKEALKNAIEYLPSVIQKHLISSWLEDMNWHTENRLFCEQTMHEIEQEQLEHLHWFDVAIHGSLYPSMYRHENMKTIQKYAKIVLHSPDDYYYIPEFKGAITKSMIREYRKAEELYSALSKIFGWGLTTADWGSTSGQAFVDEVKELLEDARA